VYQVVECVDLIVVHVKGIANRRIEKTMIKGKKGQTMKVLAVPAPLRRPPFTPK